MTSNTSKCRYYNLSRALPLVVGDYVEIGKYVAGDYSGMGIRMTVNCFSDANTTSYCSIFEIAPSYDLTEGAFEKLLPVESSSAGTPIFQVEIAVGLDTTTLRIVRLVGNATATCEVAFEFRDYARFLTSFAGPFFELTGTGATGGASTKPYVGSSLMLSGESSNEISTLAQKVTPTTSDVLLIEDAADSNKKKQITIASLPAAAPAAHAFAGSLHSNDTVTNMKTKLTGDADRILSSQAGEISLYTSKAAPTTSDLLVIEDAADSNKKKQITIATLPAAAPALHAASHAFGGTDVTGIQTAATNSKHYTGFPNRTDSTLGFVDGTLTFSLTGTFDVYGLSIKYTPTAGQKSIPITNVTGLYWIWYTFPLGVPTLNQSVNFPGFDQCLVATVYWNAATAKGRLSDERHAVGRDPMMHEYNHDTLGMRYANGLDAAFTLSTFSINPGEVYDEELPFTITPAKTVIDVLYKNGSTAWVWDAANVTPYKLNGTSLRYNNGNALADVPSGSFVAYWVFATASLVNPFISIMGQRVDTNIANCRANATPANLSLGSLPSAEMKLLYRVIFSQSGGSVVYHEATDYRAGQATTVSGFVVADHAGLSNLAYNVANHSGFFTLASGEIVAVTAKVTPADADVILIEDSADLNKKKSMTTANHHTNMQAVFRAGTAAAGSAPIKFTSGANMAAPEVGAMNFVTDDVYITITTGAARKTFVLADGTLTPNRIPYVGTNGRLTDSANVLYQSNNVIQADGIFIRTMTAGRIFFGKGSNTANPGKAGFTFNDGTDTQNVPNITLAGLISVTPAAVTTIAHTGTAVPVTRTIVEIATDGDGDEDNGTIADGTVVGQMLEVVCQAQGSATDTFKLTPTNFLNATPVMFDAPVQGKGATFIWTSASKWVLIGERGAVLPYGSMYLSASNTSITIVSTGAWVAFASGWSDMLSRGVTFQNSKELKILVPGRYRFNWTAFGLAEGGNAQALKMSIMVNGSVDTIYQATNRASIYPYQWAGTGIRNFAANDTIGLGAVNDTDTAAIYYDSANLTIQRIS